MLGTAVCIVIGTVLNSIGMGVAFGAGIGLIVGAAWGRRLGGSGVQGGYLPRAYSEEHPTSGAELHNFMSISVHQEDLFIGGM